jgi:C-terminal processing protease CtpA/Prc
MVRNMKNIFLTTILIIVTNCFSQINVSAENQKAIIQNLSNQLKKYYFNSANAISISDTLAVISTKSKSEIKKDDFENTINAALYKKSNDNHLKLYYNPDKFKNFKEDSKTKRQYEYESAEKVNFGFTKIEILEGNIGYIEIISFSGFIAEKVAQKIASAMNMVENTNALIIDLRKNGGGDGRVGDILETYFYPEENEVYYDSISKCEKFRVLPFVSGKRYLNKPVYILTSLNTFSAAEGFSKLLQKNKKALIIGEKTKGGGSSGSSVPLLNDFLCFIPTSASKTDEEASVKPDIVTNEKDALIYSKYLFYKEELKKNLNKTDKEIIQWNIQTTEHLLNLNKINYKYNINLNGSYEGDRKIYSKNEKVFIEFNNSNYMLKQIGENEFIIEGFENNFGSGNRRIIFNAEGFTEKIYFNGQLMNKYWKKT